MEPANLRSETNSQDMLPGYRDIMFHLRSEQDQLSRRN